MSETIRDLVVSLSLQTDNFTRNIKSVNTQIKEAESTFKLAGAGVENFEKTSSGLAAKLTTLTRKMELQKTSVEQHQKALEAAKKKLEECKANQEHYTKALADANTELQKAEQEHGKESEAYKKAEENVKKLTGQVEAERKATQNASDTVSWWATNLNNAEAQVRTLQTALAKNGIELTAAEKGFYTAGFAIEGNEKAVASLGKQMQLAESKFRLAGAGIENFGKKAAGVAAKLDLLKDKQTILRQQVEQLRDAVKNAQTQLEAAKAAGDTEKIREAEDKLNELNATLNITEAELRDVTNELNLQSSAWTRTGTSLANFASSAKTVSLAMVSTGRTMTRWITTPLVSLTTAAVNAEIQFEKTFATVRKTVSGTEEDYARLEAASKQMSTEMAAGTDEINAVMSTAGQLGIATENIESFAKTMIDLGNSTTDLDANTAATEIAKFINIMGTSQKDVDRLGSSLAYIGNRYATTEAPIMEMAMRIAGAGKQVGMTEAEVLGVATALSSVGIEAQMGGSAFSKALIKMELAAEEGGEALQDFADISGMTADEFRKLWDANPTEAFIAFVKGLAQLDDEGVSTISTLQELGFTEIRLRDTMLRTVSNTQLMENAVADATKGWEENTALTKLTGEIYSTTAAKLTNLKNKASLAGQQIASDLNPTIQNLISSASDLLDKFMGLDEQQRLSIIKWGAVAAAIGPALLIMGRMIGVVGSVTGAVGKGMQAIGKFSAAVTAAGGGWTGFKSVLGSSKLTWVAVGAVIAAVAVGIYDVASGAKAAREALEGLNKTAETWKNTAAETFYGSGEGLGFFGMSTDDFLSGTKQTAKVTTNAAQDWMDGMIAVWSDGKYETDAIVKEWQDSSAEVSKETLERMKELRTQAQESGDTAKAQELDADIAALEALDKRISDNLRFFQGKTLTDANKAFWQGLTDEKQAILLKWGFTEEPVGGNEAYETIAKKVEAARARAQAIGKDDADATVYEEAVLAASQGFAAISKQIDEQYDAEYANIQLMADGAEKTAALEKLNTDYVQQRKQAATEYAAAMQNVILPVWNQSDVQKAKADVKDMVSLMATYNAQEGDQKAQAETLEKMNTLAASMSEGSLTEYYTLLTQIQSLLDYGIPESTIKEWFPDINYSAGLEQLAAIQEFLNNRPGQLTGLASIFGEALPEEVIKIATDLDMTGAQARWNEFAQNPGAITTQAVIDDYELGEKAKAQQFKVDAFIKKYTEVPEGADKSSLTIDGLLAYVKTYAEQTTGADVSNLTPENLTAIVSAYDELAAGADVSALTPDQIAAYVPYLCRYQK